MRPAGDHGAEKWQTGTANFEAIAGGLAAVGYLQSLGGPPAASRRERLRAAFAAIEAHESPLCARLLNLLQAIPGLRVVGLADARRLHERCATVSFVPPGTTPEALSATLAERGIFTWAGHSYAVALADALGLSPHGVLRAGLLHYHLDAEVERFAAEVRQLVACTATRES